MASSDKYAMFGTPPNRYAEMHCAIYKQTPRTHIYIGAPTLEDLETAWKEITGFAIDKQQVQRVHVFTSNHDPCLPPTTSGSTP